MRETSSLLEYGDAALTFSLWAKSRSQLPACLGCGNVLVEIDKLIKVNATCVVKVKLLKLLHCERLNLCRSYSILHIIYSLSLSHPQICNEALLF